MSSPYSHPSPPSLCGHPSPSHQKSSHLQTSGHCISEHQPPVTQQAKRRSTPSSLQRLEPQYLYQICSNHSRQWHQRMKMFYDVLLFFIIYTFLLVPNVVTTIVHDCQQSLNIRMRVNEASFHLNVDTNDIGYQMPENKGLRRPRKCGKRGGVLVRLHCHSS